MESRLVFRSLFLSSQIDPAEKQKCRGKKINQWTKVDWPPNAEKMCLPPKTINVFIYLD